MEKSEGNLIPKRLLGKTGDVVSILGLGGEGLLRTYGQGQEATSLIHRAIDLGLTYFESARAYAGSESYYGTALGERRKEIFLASKSHERTLDGASGHLEATLKNMKTDFLDLWMVHDVRTIKDINQIFGPQGAIRAFESARRNKLVKWIGISGHRNPTILFLNPTQEHLKSPFTPAYRQAGTGERSVRLETEEGVRGVCINLKSYGPVCYF